MKKEIYKNPEKYKYKRNMSFNDFIYLEGKKEILKRKCESLSSKSSVEEEINSHINFVDNKEIISFSLVDGVKLDFNENDLRINGYKLTLKPHSYLSEALSKFLKIPYSSFFKTNSDEFNQDLISHFFKRENFKDRDAGLKMNLLISKEDNQIIYVYQPKEFSSAIEKVFTKEKEIFLKESLVKFINEGLKLYNHHKITDRTHQFVFVNQDKKQTFGSNFLMEGKLIEIDTFIGNGFIKNVIIDITTNNYFVSDNVNFNLDKIKSIDDVSLGSLGLDNTQIISELFLILALRNIKIDSDLVEFGIFQLLEEYSNLSSSTLLDLMMVVNTFAKTNKYSEYIKVSNNISTFINCVFEGIKNNENIVNNKFLK